MIEHLQGDSLKVLRLLEPSRFQCCVTSPPYWGLRDYDTAGQLGMEPTVELYVAALVEIFREVKRVMKPDGTLWLNLGDTYSSDGGHSDKGGQDRRAGYRIGQRPDHAHRAFRAGGGVRPKNMVGVPWLVALALQADGWYLRSDIIWHKPNAMPESVRDRPTKAHEHFFLLSMQERYHYDAAAIRERCLKTGTPGHLSGGTGDRAGTRTGLKGRYNGSKGRNRRDVWSVPTVPFVGAHFATFPPELIRPAIRAGCPAGGTVLDPFGGSGTTGLVCHQEGRSAVLIELSPKYVDIATKRCGGIVGVEPERTTKQSMQAGLPF